MNTLIRPQNVVPVALRTAVDRIIYQDYLPTTGAEHIKVLRLGLCRQVCVATSKFSTKAVVYFWNKMLSTGEIFRERGSAEGM
jgi:hypothetical protein